MRFLLYYFILILFAGVVSGTDYQGATTFTGNLSYVDGGSTTQTFDMVTTPTDDYVWTYDSGSAVWQPEESSMTIMLDDYEYYCVAYSDGSTVQAQARNGTIIYSGTYGTDDFTVLQNALDYSSGHRLLVIGDWHLGATGLGFPDACCTHLEGIGRGSTRIYYNGSGDIINKDYGSAQTGLAIRNLELRDEGSHASTGINCSQFSGADITNIRMVDVDTGIYVPFIASTLYNTADGLYIDAYGEGLNISYNDNIFRNVRIRPQGTDCVGLKIRGRNNFIDGFSFESDGNNTAILIDYNPDYAGSGDGNIVSNFYIENVDKAFDIDNANCSENMFFGGKVAVCTTALIEDASNSAMLMARAQYNPVYTIPTNAPHSRATIRGAIYIDTATNRLYLHDGTGWNYATLTTT